MVRTDIPGIFQLFGTAALCVAHGIGAALLVGGTISLVAPSPAQATPAYAQQTKLACGQCHVNPAGGGPQTAFGKSFAAHGHKVK